MSQSQISQERHIVKPFASAPRVAGSALSVEYAVDEFTAASLLVDLTAISGAPSVTSLAVKLQYSPDRTGTRWYDLPNGAITALAATGRQQVTDIDLGVARRIRVSYTVSFTGGTAPTGTFEVDLSLEQSPGSAGASAATSDPSFDSTTNARRVEGATLEVTGLSVNTLNGDLVPSTDVSAFDQITVQITAMPASSTIQFQASIDGVNWFNLSMIQSSANGAGTFGTTTTAAGLFTGSSYNAHYFRARMTVYGGSGSATGAVRYSTLYSGAQYMNISGQVTSGSSTGASVPTTVFPIGGRDSSGLLQIANEDSQRGLFTAVAAATVNPTNVSVATTSTSVLGANTSRKSLVLSNNGANNIYINFGGGTATANNFLLVPNANVILDRWVSQTAITAIAATSATVLSVTELS